MARKKKGGDAHLEGAGGMRWLLTYADLITLLLAYFIILASSSNVDAAKFHSLSAALSAAFGLNGNPALLNGGGAEGDKPIVFPTSQLQLQELKNKLAKHILEQKLDPAINLHLNERGLLIRIYADKVRFAKGSAELSPVYRKLLDKVADILATTPNSIQVNGYTDDSPAGNGRNWDISTMRAVNTVKYLVKRGIAGERLSAAGYSEFVPLVPNSDEIHRSMNRRIDIQVFRAPVLDEGISGGQVDHHPVTSAKPVPSPNSGVNPLTF